MVILRSRRVVTGASLISLRSRIIDMKRRAVQLSKSRQEPACRAKDKRESVDRRTHGVREVLRPELGKIETLKTFLLLFLFEEVNSWHPRNESSHPGDHWQRYTQSVVGCLIPWQICQREYILFDRPLPRADDILDGLQGAMGRFQHDRGKGSMQQGWTLRAPVKST